MEWRGVIQQRRAMIPYRQISSVVVESSLLFAAVRITATGQAEPIIIEGLWKGDAKRLAAMIAARQ